MITTSVFLFFLKEVEKAVALNLPLLKVPTSCVSAVNFVLPVIPYVIVSSL